MTMMVELMITEETQQASPAQPFERGTRYVIRIRKQDGLPSYSTEFYLRKVFRNLQRTALEDTSIVLINPHRHMFLLTSHLHPEDADAIRKEFAVFPEVEMYPVVEDVEQGDPYLRVFCVRTFPNRKSTRLPKVAGYLSNYRWVVYEKVGGEKHGILISEEPNVFPYPADLSSEAYLITASDEEDSIRFADLTGYRTWFSVPLFYSCL
jgi:hypothetical protein